MSTPLTQFTRLIDEAFNAGDFSRLNELVAPHCVEHQFARPGHPAPTVGTRSVTRIVTELRSGAPDFHLAIEDSSVTGDVVWARLRARGTDTGSARSTADRAALRDHRHRHSPVRRRQDGRALGRARPLRPAPTARTLRVRSRSDHDMSGVAARVMSGGKVR